MVWQNQMISAQIGEELYDCYARVEGGIAVIEHLAGANEVPVYYVLHLPTGKGIGYLFCQAHEITSIVGQIVAMQDWMSVRSRDDILASTHEAIAEFRSRYVFYRELPPELELLLVRAEAPARAAAPLDGGMPVSPS